MSFKEFKEEFQENFSAIVANKSYLFLTDVDSDVLWETYLDSFPPGTNEIYRERREMDCSCCRHFIKRFGNVVLINKNNQAVSIWDFESDDTFSPVMSALSNLVKSAPVKDVFVTKESKHGTDKNRELLDNGDVRTWNHFFIDLPNKFVFNSNKSVNEIKGEFRDIRNVFKRSLEEITQESIETILDLIVEKTLYRGEEWQAVLTKFLKLHKKYHSLSEDEKDNFCWSKSVEVGGAIGKIRNHSIGTLLQDISNGVDLMEAIRKYEHIVAPTNYKRPKAIFTKKMVEDAQKTIEGLGLIDSLGRRYAIITDITINNVLWANRNAEKQMNGLDIFEELKQESAVKPKKYEHAPGIGIEEFIESVLPNATDIKVLLENRHEPNFMSLIAPKVLDSPTLFKWDNSFSWAYDGNIADSMKQRVKSAGGNVDGVLRFSLQWNDNYDNRNDYDAHCEEPNGNHIWFQNKGRKHQSSGMLDVDIIHPGSREVAVENITWTNINRMQEGEYTFYVHNYSHNGGRSGFDAEIEYNGKVYEFAYHKDLSHNENVIVAKIKFDKRDGIKIIESLPTTTTTKNLWNLTTNSFHPVSTFMYSPNHWDGQGVGNKHYLFMLTGCINENQPNGFFNEYLKEEFMEHKRVFAALGSKMKVEESDNQLSGLGFSSTKQNSLICEVDKKIIKIVF